MALLQVSWRGESHPKIQITLTSFFENQSKLCKMYSPSESVGARWSSSAANFSLRALAARTRPDSSGSIFNVPGKCKMAANQSCLIFQFCSLSPVLLQNVACHGIIQEYVNTPVWFIFHICIGDSHNLVWDSSSKAAGISEFLKGHTSRNFTRKLAISRKNFPLHANFTQTSREGS